MTLDIQFLTSVQAANDLSQARWTAGDTPLLRLPASERIRRLGYVPGGGEPSLAERERISSAKRAMQREILAAPSYPSSFDWRNVQGRNFISSIKDQGSCGSCVAFGTVAALEGTARAMTNIAFNDQGGGGLTDLSEAQLFYCGNTFSDPCGNGWYVSAALQYCSNTGLVPESCFPYSPGNQSCNIKCSNWQTMVTQVSANHTITSSSDMKTWLSSRGPLIACFIVYSDFFAYKDGVYSHHSGGVEGGHCICCVGYDDTLQAWLCKNSWGTDWGIGGYFWIAYGQCGIDATMWAIDSFSSIYPLYNDLFMRTNLSDVGLVPAVGSACTSPDIIPYGSLPYRGDAKSFFVSNYSSDVGQNVLSGEQNYIYVRAKSLAQTTDTGNIYLYWSRASLLNWPSKWSQNPLKTEKRKSSVTVSTSTDGQVVVGESPFIWSPQSINNDHYCLISRIETSTHPNPIPEDGTIDDFTAYVLNNRGVGWRNVILVKGDTPTWQVPVNLSVTNACQLLIQLECANVPLGCAVQFTCGTEGPDPQLTLNKTLITTQPNQTMGIWSQLPESFDSTITVSFWLNQNKALLPQSQISLCAYRLLTSDHPLAKFGRPLASHQIATPIKGNEAIQPTTAILIGRFVLQPSP